MSGRESHKPHSAAPPETAEPPSSREATVPGAPTSSLSPSLRSKRRLELAIEEADSLPPPSDAASATSTVGTRVARNSLPPQIAKGTEEAKLIRGLAHTLGLTGLGWVATGAICVQQWTFGRASVPMVMSSVLVFGVGFWSLFASFHLHRVTRSKRGARRLVQAFDNLRSIFILKAVGLILILTLSCFVFSIAASLLALL